MKEIELTKGYTTIIDDIDSDLCNLSWYTHETKKGKIYAARSVRTGLTKKTIFLHQIVLERKINRELLDSEYPDHKNSNGLDNTRQNIRLATSKQNAQNRKRSNNNKSGYKGVSFSKKTGKWMAFIEEDGKSINLGGFETRELAHKAYCDKADELFVEFARYE